VPDYASFSPQSPYAYQPGSSGYRGDQGFSPGYYQPGIVPQRPVATALPPIWDPQRALYVNPQTGQPHTGKLPSGQYSTAGRISGAPPIAPPAGKINPLTGQQELAPSQQFDAVSIPKQPDVSKATSDLLDTFKTTAAASLKDFSSYLNDFKTNLGTAQTAATKAENIQPTVDALTGQQKQYAGGVTQAQADLAGVNKTANAAETGSVAEAKGLLPSYDAAGQAIADRQMQLAVGNLSRYKMGSGTPTSAGTDETNILANAASAAMLPLKQSEIAQRYNIINNLELPVTRDIASRGAGQAAFDVSTARDIFSSGQATTKDIQNLAQQVRTMSYQDAMNFMQAAGIPAQIQHQIISGQISELSGLSGLESASNYQGLQDLTGMSLTPAQYYNQGTGGYSVNSRYAPTTGTGTNAPGLRAANAPVEVGAGGLPSWIAQSRYNQAQTSQGNQPNVGAQSNSHWDSNLGVFVDNNTGAITGWGYGGSAADYVPVDAGGS
jgi:hypothetical protein